ncbi:MAG: cytochrome C [Desulfobacteraceae bacterium]|nr:MAG: cytochrome C [Desulfobacteraceae bacterium]
MTSQRDLKVAIILMIILLVTGFICYASFSPPTPDEPIRIMFQNKGGKVLFTHSGHMEDYGLDCLDCHHNIEDDDTYNCSECHESTGDEDLPSRADAFHIQCQGCHEEGGGPVECNSCHAL